jgi:hypothetical protein
VFWRGIGSTRHDPVGSRPSTVSWSSLASSSSHLRKSSPRPKACRRRDRVTTVYTSCPTRPRLRCGPTDIRNFKKMCLKPSVPLCSSRASYAQVRLPSPPRCSW